MTLLVHLEGQKEARLKPKKSYLMLVLLFRPIWKVSLDPKVSLL